MISRSELVRVWAKFGRGAMSRRTKVVMRRTLGQTDVNLGRIVTRVPGGRHPRDAIPNRSAGRPRSALAVVLACSRAIKDTSRSAAVDALLQLLDASYRRAGFLSAGGDRVDISSVPSGDR